MDRRVTFLPEELSGHDPQTGLDTKTVNCNVTLTPTLLESVSIRKVLRPVTLSRFSVIFLSLRENMEFVPKTHVAIH
jgi:hypothetical protein